MRSGTEARSSTCSPPLTRAPTRPRSAQAQRSIYEAAGSSSAGGPLRTFLPSHYRDAGTCYEPATLARLRELKATWDPADLFSYAPAL